jgi:L-ribulose-5-phosphate 3-epimerase
MSDLSKIPLGLYEKALPPDLSWPERLITAARIGYDFVEISIDDSDGRIARLEWGAAERTALRSAMLDTGVPIKSLSLSAHRRFPMGSRSPETRQRGLDIFRKTIDFAWDTGIRFILVAGCDVYYEDNDEGTLARFTEGLHRGLEWASAAGVLLALENWDVPCANSVHKAMQFVNHFNSPWFQHYVDIGNLAYAGYDVVSELDAGRGHYAAVHVKDTVPGQLRYVPVGEGVVPFVDAFARLAELDFQGPMVIELWTEQAPDAVQQAEAAGQRIRSYMQEGWQIAAARLATISAT